MKNSKGITLIALVVTIVVLLILAGISIAMLTGENGIILKARDSKLQSEIGEEKDAVALAYTAAKASKLGKTVVVEDMNKQLQYNGTKAIAEKGTNVIIVKFIESKRVYKIEENGKITGPTISSEQEGVLEVPETFESSFDAGYKDGTVTSDIKGYIVEIEGVTDENGQSVYDIIFIGKGEMAPVTEWDTWITLHEAGMSFVLWNVAIRNVEISYGVTSISDNTFYGCSTLTNITIPNSVTYIGNKAFYECTELTSIKIPNSITSMGEYVFYKCSSLENIVISEGVTSIGKNVFNGCTGLKNVKIPNSVISIEDYAFFGCSSLTNITIPEGVTSIRDSAFAACGLTSIKVNEKNTMYDSRNNCNAIIEKNTNTLIFGCKNTIIPSTVTSIGDNAFYRCSGLTSITIPEGVTSIGDSAFESCSSLASITFPESITSIGYRAFKDTAWFYDDVQNPFGADYYVGKVYFYGGYNESEETELKIKDGTVSIAGGAYTGWALTNVIIPTSVIEIGYGAFAEGRLETINYKGTEEQWEQIIIKEGNEYLTNVTVNYNYVEE